MLCPQTLRSCCGRTVKLTWFLAVLCSQTLMTSIDCDSHLARFLAMFALRPWYSTSVDSVTVHVTCFLPMFWPQLCTVSLLTYFLPCLPSDPNVFRLWTVTVRLLQDEEIKVRETITGILRHLHEYVPSQQRGMVPWYFTIFTAMQTISASAAPEHYWHYWTLLTLLTLLTTLSVTQMCALDASSRRLSLTSQWTSCYISMVTRTGRGAWGRCSAGSKRIWNLIAQRRYGGTYP